MQPMNSRNTKGQKMTPTQAARKHCVRRYGILWFTGMSKLAQKQLLAAYVAGVRHGRNK